MRNKISVVVPAFNSEKTLKTCLRSIRRATFSEYELLVIDDGSSDKTPEIAQQYADKVVRLKKNKGLVNARKVGLEHARGEIVLYIDSDIKVPHNILDEIYSQFLNTSVVAVTGILSRNSYYKNFSSQYKNLYMNYYFSRLPDYVSFLYGSLFAVRHKVLSQIAFEYKGFYAEDTNLGQLLVKKKYKIKLLRSPQVEHIKRYSFRALIINDYKISFSWAGVFLTHKGWKQLFRSGTGFAHASKSQIVSLLISPLIIIFLFVSAFWKEGYILVIGAVFIWSYLNLMFHLFLYKQKGFLFSLKGVIFTFLDNIVMFTGVVRGSLKYILSKRH